MNETLKVLETRRSCRNFKPGMIKDEELKAIVKAGTFAATGMGNLMNAAESLGVASIWIHRAKEEFDSDFGKTLLKKLGIEGDYEGIGHCALGYAAEPTKAPAPRKENYVYYV